MAGVGRRPGAPQRLVVGRGLLAPGSHGFVATLQPNLHFGRILAAYGGVFVASSLACDVVTTGYEPDRFDLIGAGVQSSRHGQFVYVRVGWAGW